LAKEKMSAPLVTLWSEAPEPAIPDLPAVLADDGSLFVAYRTARGYAVVRFEHVIDHHLSPINDEGLGRHPYAKYGLKWYSFNEVAGSNESLAWSALRARHWVITFKDVTLDVLATGARVVAAEVLVSSPLAALLTVVPQPKAP
jgi:hypothetical protein